MRRRAAKHRDRRRLLCAVFEKGRAAGGAQRLGPGARQGDRRVVRRAANARARGADAAFRDRAGRGRCVVPAQSRTWVEAAVGIARAGGSGGRGRLCRDPARRLGLVPQPVEITGPGHRQAASARRQAAGGRRPDEKPGAGEYVAPDRPRGRRGVLFGVGDARHRRPATSRSVACTSRRISRRSAQSGSSRSMRRIAVTTFTNARPTGRGSSR